MDPNKLNGIFIRVEGTLLFHPFEGRLSRPLFEDITRDYPECQTVYWYSHTSRWVLDTYTMGIYVPGSRKTYSHPNDTPKDIKSMLLLLQ